MPVKAGEQLKEIRRRLSITTREVEEWSRSIAEAEGNNGIYISNPWLTQIENKDSVPSIYKLYSLSVIYRIKFTDLLALYGLDLEKIGKYQFTTPLEKTHLTSLEVYDKERAVSFPIRFDQGFRLDRTSLLSRVIEAWGEVPLALIQHLDLRHGLFGFIGVADYTLYPLLRPGSFVQIDGRHTRVETFAWRTEFERPIYFLELRDGYACGWCELEGDRLTLLPHPLSPVHVRYFACPQEAEIVGRVTGVAMRIIRDAEAPSSVPAKLPARP